MGRKIEDNEIIGLQCGDYIIIGINCRKSGGILVNVKCVICERVSQRWYKDLKNNIGDKHSHCIRNIEKDDILKKLRTVHSGFKDRTSNPKNIRYQEYYGVRGISYSDGFEHLIDFYDYAKPILMDAINFYGVGAEKLSCDRIDNNGNYEKGNIRFTTQDIQIDNSRKILGKKRIFTNIVTSEEIVFVNKQISEIAEYFNVSKSAINSALNKKTIWKNYSIRVEKCND